MLTQIAKEISFQLDGNGRDFQGAGWSNPEPNWTWATSDYSELFVPINACPNGLFIEIDLGTFSPYPYRLGQSLTVIVNDKPVRTVYLTGDHKTIAVQAPPCDDGVLKLLLLHPDGMKPFDVGVSGDQRILSFSFRRIRVLQILNEDRGQPSVRNSEWRPVSSLSEALLQAQSIAGNCAEKFFSHFETIAGNCDLGLAQVALGVNNLALMRFAGGTKRLTTELLDNCFDNVGKELATEIGYDLDGRPEWMIRDSVGLRYHSRHSPQEKSPDEIISSGNKMISFLKRKILSDLQDVPNKTYVVLDHDSSAVEEILPLFLALHRHGPHNLVWARHTGEGVPSADEMMPGLVHARINVTLKPHLGRLSLGGWIAALANVEALSQKSRKLGL
jgi:hypothetical protein